MELCNFNEAWIGPCQNPKPCEEHSHQVCSSCGQPATQSCAETMGLVCGAPLCNDCEHTISEHGTNRGPLPKGLKAHCKKSEQVYQCWMGRHGSRTFANLSDRIMTTDLNPRVRLPFKFGNVMVVFGTGLMGIARCDIILFKDGKEVYGDVDLVLINNKLLKEFESNNYADYLKAQSKDWADRKAEYDRLLGLKPRTNDDIRRAFALMDTAVDPLFAVKEFE